MSNVQAQLQQAIGLHQTGQLAEAGALYEAVLATQPKNFDALHLSGRLAAQTGNYPKALEFMNKAIKVNPAYAEAYYNRGIIQQELALWDMAQISYDRAIALKPDYAQAYSNRSVVLQELKQWEAALASCETAIKLKPDYAQAWYNRGVIFQEFKQWDDALASYDRAIAFKPDYAEAFSNLGLVFQEQKQWDAALASHDQAITLKPGYAEGYSNRGVTFQKLKRWDSALASYDKAIALKPDYAEAHFNQADVLKELKKLEAALISYDKAIALKPHFAEAHSGRGVILQELGQMEAALASYNHAIALKPDYAEVYSNRGNILTEFKQIDAALASYDQVIRLKPDLVYGHYNKSFALLLSGDFDAGWKEYEWRWKADAFISPRRNFSQPLWLGEEPLKGKTILLHREQGLGDTIQFCRYALLVAGLGAKVILLVQPTLMEALSGLAGVAQLVADDGSPLPAFDYHCPLVSLPLAFKTNLNNIPATAKYLSSAPEKLDQWRATLGEKTKPRIGLVWRGSMKHSNDRNRSIALPDLLKYLPDGFQYVSLQKETDATDKAFLQAHPQILHFGDALHDFADTAALCDAMDVVITIDTSVAHLSAALGRPTWVLLPLIPDWRWLLDRQDSPWYPTAKLYRQEKPGEWEGVFERIKADIVHSRP